MFVYTDKFSVHAYFSLMMLMVFGAIIMIGIFMLTAGMSNTLSIVCVIAFSVLMIIFYNCYRSFKSIRKDEKQAVKLKQ